MIFFIRTGIVHQPHEVRIANISRLIYGSGGDNGGDRWVTKAQLLLMPITSGLA